MPPTRSIRGATSRTQECTHPNSSSPGARRRDRAGARGPGRVASRRGADVSAGYGSGEIGALMGWTEPRARNLVYRGLADLREALSRRGVGPEGIMNDDELRKPGRPGTQVRRPSPRQRNCSGLSPAKAPTTSAWRSSTGRCPAHAAPAISSCFGRSHNRAPGPAPTLVALDRPLALAASVLLVTVGVLLRRDVAREETRATPADGSPVLVAPATDAHVTDAGQLRLAGGAGRAKLPRRVAEHAGTLGHLIETPDTTARSALAGVARADSSYRWVVVALLPRVSKSRPATAGHPQGTIGQRRQRNQ